MRVWQSKEEAFALLTQTSLVQILTPQNVLNGYSGVALRQVPVKDSGLGDSIAQRCAYLLLDPAAPGLFPSIPKIFLEEKIINVDEVNQRRWLEERGQWLENVNQTFFEMASSKPLLPKRQWTP